MVDLYDQINKTNFTSSRGLTFSEDIFKDHFPNFPVLPGVLSLQMVKQTIDKYLSDNNLKNFEMKEIKQVKFIKFARPGDMLQASINIKQINPTDI